MNLLSTGIFPVLLLLLATARAGGPPRSLPMEREAWEKVNPLGGEFEGGRYVQPRELAPSFEASRTVPAASNIVFEATFTPGRKTAEKFGCSVAIALLESPGRYWRLYLTETRPGAHTVGLTELGGASQIQNTLPILADEGVDAAWEWGRTYRLRLALDASGAEGEVRDAATGALLFRRRYGLAPAHIASGRPAFQLSRMVGEFGGLSVEIDHGTHETHGTEPPAQGNFQPQSGDFKPEGPFTAANGGDIAPRSGFYRTTRDADGRWWFVDPQGGRFFLCGIGVVSHNGFYNAALGYAPYARTVERKYPTLEDWATNSLARIRSWGFNFLSSPSAILLRRGFPHAHVVNIGQDFACYGDEFDLLPCDGGPCSGFPNVFHPLWPAYCRFRAQEVCSADRDDPWTLGWYIDNELSWWGDKRKFKTPPARGLFDAAARKAPDHPARQALEEFLAAKNPKERKDFANSASFAAEKDILDTPVELKREFVRLVARKYFECTTAAIHEAAPNHLILGCRFAGFGSADPVVWEECGRFCDVVSVNSYPMVDLDRGVAVSGFASHDRKIEDILRERARYADKPVIMTEWGFSALDSGLPCTHGAGQRFFTQRERAEATSIFARTMWAMPEVGGYVYFMWCDEPAVGKNGPKSENTNYGLVNENDEPYEEQTAALAAVQCHAEESRHAETPRERAVVPPEAADMARLLSHAENAESAEAPARQKSHAGFAEGAEGEPHAEGTHRNGTPRTSRTPREPQSSHPLRVEGFPLRVEGDPLRVCIGTSGTFAIVLREYSRGSAWWSSATQVLQSPEPSGDIVTLCGKSAVGGPFEVDVRFHRPEGCPFVLAELLCVRNGGGKPLPFDAAYFRLLPADKAVRENTVAARGDDVFAPPAEGQPTPVPPMLWRPWQSGAWVLPDDTVLGMLSPRRTGVQIRFWKDASLHADAAYMCGRRTLAPGEAWEPTPGPFVLAAEVSGGEEAWRALCADIRAEAASLEGRSAASPDDRTAASPDGRTAASPDGRTVFGLPSVRIIIDPTRTLGPVKPVNGVGQPPILGLRKFTMFHYLQEAGVPFSRLHDVGGMYGRGIFVDIPNLFRDFDADENDPASYDFAFTDRLVNALVEHGVEPMFRLGVTLENYRDIRRYRIDPPKDFAKWARICEHVVRHYTEGWADGFHHTITRWEIWNEPDNWPDPDDNESWHGTFDEYCRLYEVASKHLKTAFPHLKIGGPASCGVRAALTDLVPEPSERERHQLECFHRFLRFVREHDCPLDFFSHHSYGPVETMLAEARTIREKLDKAGFAGVPTCFDEWLPEPSHEKLGTAEQAAEIAAALIGFQNGPVDSAAIYDARCSIGKYSVLFNPLTYEPHKAYYAFLAFHALRQRGTAVPVVINHEIHETHEKLYAAAATPLPSSPSPLPSHLSPLTSTLSPLTSTLSPLTSDLALLFVNTGDEAAPFTLEIGGQTVSAGSLAGAAPSAPLKARIVDAERTWEEIPLPDTLPPHSILLVETEN